MKSQNASEGAPVKSQYISPTITNISGIRERVMMFGVFMAGEAEKTPPLQSNARAEPPRTSRLDRTKNGVASPAPVVFLRRSPHAPLYLPRYVRPDYLWSSRRTFPRGEAV